MRKPKKRLSAAERLATVEGASSAHLATKSRQNVRRSARSKRAETLGGAIEVIAIGGKRVAGRAGFGGHHVEKAVD